MEINKFICSNLLRLKAVRKISPHRGAIKMNKSGEYRLTCTTLHEVIDGTRGSKVQRLC